MRRTFDTVEEFWEWQHVEDAYALAGPASVERFRNAFGSFIGVAAKAIELMPSGHQGLEWLLRSRRDSRRQVLVAAFNCSVVQEAIETAGYEPKIYDFSLYPGCIDWRQLIAEMDEDVGVIIVTHYFGVPIDFRPLLSACKDRGIAIIEDCAHTLGGKIGDQQVGTLGDAAIFSFNYDKPISLGWGGLTVINNSSAFDKDHPHIFRTPSPDEEIRQLREFVMAMADRRKMIPYQQSLAVKIVRRLGMLNTRQFKRAPDLSIGAVQAELGCWCLEQFSKTLAIRIDNANRIIKESHVTTWPVGADVQPAWLKQKILIRNEQAIRRLTTLLQRRGLRVGNFNWPSLIGRKVNCQKSAEAATYWVGVPVHQNLDGLAMATMILSFNHIN